MPRAAGVNVRFPREPGRVECAAARATPGTRLGKAGSPSVLGRLYPVLRQETQQCARQGLVAVEGAVVRSDSGRSHEAAAGSLGGRRGLRVQHARPDLVEWRRQQR